MDRALGVGSRLVKVYVAQDPFEAHILLGVLRREGIEAVCLTNEEIAYDGLFVLQRGWGNIMVPEPMVDKAMEVVEEYRKAYKYRVSFRVVDGKGTGGE